MITHILHKDKLMEFKAIEDNNTIRQFRLARY